MRICVLICFNIFLLMSCRNTEDKIVNFIEKNNNSPNTQNMEVDLQNVLNIKFDTLYLFGEYTQKELIGAILNLNYENNKLIKDGYKRIILVKNHRIVYEDDYVPIKIKISRGIKVKKNILGREEEYIIYINSKFKIEKVDNDIGVSTKYFYILKNIQKDGVILPRDTSILDY